MRSTSSAAPSTSAENKRELPPALTKQQALAEIGRYATVNNKANTNRDRDLLDTIEDGPLYAMSVSEYKATESLTKSERKAYKPWAYDKQNAKLYIPRIASGQPRWFAAALSSTKGKVPDRLVVFAEQPQHKRWEMVFVADLYGTDLPKVAMDADAYATVVTTNGNKGLPAGADLLRSGILDNFATGGQSSGKKVFTRSKASSQQIKVHGETVKQYGSQGTSTFARLPAGNPHSSEAACRHALLSPAPPGPATPACTSTTTAIPAAISHCSTPPTSTASQETSTP